MVRIHWAEDWSEALNAHLPAFLGQGLALKPPWWLTVILQDPSPDKISLCRTDLETFYTLSHRLTLSEGFSRRGFIRGCLSVVDLSHSLCLTHGIQSLLGLCTQGYILWKAACALVWSNSPSRALVPPATAAKGMCLGLKQIPWGEWISGLLRFVHPFSSQFPYLSHLSFCWLFHFLITLFLEKGGRERKYSIQPVSTDFHFHSAYDNGQARLLLGVSTTDKIFALFVQLEQI